MKKIPISIREKIAKAEPERLNNYIEMFDRLLLYNLAANTIPQEVMDDILDKWEDTVKKAIDMESNMRTTFLESTPQGRLSKKQQQPDGEQVRLLYLDTLDAAKDILKCNLHKDENDDGFETFNNFE